MYALHSNSSNVRTVISTNSYTFCWEIENFSKLPLRTYVVSPDFHPLPNHTFDARFWVSDKVVSYNFYKNAGSDIEIKHFASIMNNAGQIIHENISKHNYEASFSHHNIISKKVEMLINEQEKYLLDDVLILKCVMEFGTIQTKSDQYKFRLKPVSVLDDLSALSRDLEAMFETSVYADISLKVEDSLVRVHKSVMCARSSVFARMFETPMVEKKDNVINITDLDLPVLKDLVSYLYAGVLAKDDFESVYALYYAADKYDVPSLRKKCRTVLLSKLDAENACRLLTLAVQHSDVEFKDSAMDFVKFSFNEVLETDGWIELVKNAPQLATEVISAWSKKRSNKVEDDKN